MVRYTLYILFIFISFFSFSSSFADYERTWSAVTMQDLINAPNFASNLWNQNPSDILIDNTWWNWWGDGALWFCNAWSGSVVNYDTSIRSSTYMSAWQFWDGYFTILNYLNSFTTTSINNITCLVPWIEELDVDIAHRWNLTRTYDSPNGWRIDGIYTGKPLTFKIYIDGVYSFSQTWSNIWETTIESFSDDIYSEIKNYNISIDYTLSWSTLNIPFSDFTYRPKRVVNEAWWWIDFWYKIIKYENINPKWFEVRDFNVFSDTILIIYIDDIVMDRRDYWTWSSFFDYRDSLVFSKNKPYKIKIRSIKRDTWIFYDLPIFYITPIYAIWDAGNIFDEDCKFTQYDSFIRCSDFFDNNNTDLVFQLLATQWWKYYQQWSWTTINYTWGTRYLEIDGNTVFWRYDWQIPYGLPTYNYTLYVTDDFWQVRGAFEFNYSSTLWDEWLFWTGAGNTSWSDITKVVPINEDGSINTENWIQSLTRTIDNIRKFMNLWNSVTTDEVKFLNWIIPSIHANNQSDMLFDSFKNQMDSDKSEIKVYQVNDFLKYGLYFVIFVLSLGGVLILIKK